MESKIDSFLEAKRKFEEVYGYPPTVLRVTSNQWWDGFISEAREKGLLTKSAKGRVTRIAGVKVEIDDSNARVDWNPKLHGTGPILEDI